MSFVLCFRQWEFWFLFKFARWPKKSKIRKAENFLKDLNSLKANDFVAHVDHGVGIYRSLEIINISNNEIQKNR